MILIQNATIINEGKSFVGSVLITDKHIGDVYDTPVPESIVNACDKIIDAKGLWLIPGVIDEHVHFRDPGLTHKADMYSESRAAVAGGVTSFMDMPNTKPQTTTIEALDLKYDIASKKSLANYSFYFGATNENIDLFTRLDPQKICGIKVFLGASTGNMLVDKKIALENIFKEAPILVAAHCENNDIITANAEYYKSIYGEDVPIKFHPLIRSAEACFQSSEQACELAAKYGTRLHILHLSTKKEMSLFHPGPITEKKITAEVCIQHLWFCDKDYERLGAKIKWNPAVKSEVDRRALIEALNNDVIDTVATDHSPHLLSEKEGGSLKATSGGPLIQHSLQVMMTLSKKGEFSKEEVVKKMCHAPALLYSIDRRGFIRKGYFADLVLINPNKPYTVTKDNILYKCGWSPFEGETFSCTIEKTFVNGNEVFDGYVIHDDHRGEPLKFNR